MTITGLTFGPKARTSRPLPVADLPFGPCADGRSAFCEGTGTERVDPAAMVDIATAFTTVIICGACRVIREALAEGDWA